MEMNSSISWITNQQLNKVGTTALQPGNCFEELFRLRKVSSTKLLDSINSPNYLIETSRFLSISIMPVTLYLMG